MAEATGQAAPEQPDIITRLTAYLGHQQADQQEAEQAEDAPQGEEAEAQPEGEAESAEPKEPEQDSDKDELSIDPEVPFMEITTKKDGGTDETRLWSLNEMRDGVMMKADYQRKTAEVARAREQLQAEVAKSVEPARAQFIQQLQFLSKAVQSLVVPELNGVDLEKLSTESPQEFIKLQARATRAQQALTALQQQIQQAQQDGLAQQAAHSKQMLQDPIQGIPGWGDEVYSSLINDGSKHYGFTPDEVANVVDYRMIKVLHDALQFRKLQAAKPAITKKVVSSQIGRAS